MAVRFVTRLEPADKNASGKLPGAVIVKDGMAHHIIDDKTNKRCFGYDLLLEDSGKGLFQLRIEPLKISADLLSCLPGWTMLALPKYPSIPGLRVGDTVALNLLVNSATGEKVVDYLTIERVRTPEAEHAHDFSLADVQLSLDKPRVMVNGRLVQSTAAFKGGTAGAVVWMYLEGHGRFILSLFPDDKLGFHKAGITSASVLTFSDDGTEYRIECNSPVAPGQGSYGVYVVHEPHWHAHGPGDGFEVGSADKAEWVVGKH